MKFINSILISIIKLYKYFISNYRITYLFFIDCIKLNGGFEGSVLGIKRILKCHPIEFLGGDDGFDPAPNLNAKRKEK